MTRSRIPVLLVVVGALVAAAVVDRTSAPEDAPAADVAATLGRSTPVVAPADALGSTWYCAAGSAGDIGELPAPVPVAGEATPGDATTPEGDATTPEGEAEGEAETEGDATAEEDAGDEGEAAADEEETIVVGPIVAEHSVTLANLTGEDRVATLTVHAGTVTGYELDAEAPRPEPIVTTVELAAEDVQRVELADLLDAPVAAVLVEVPGGGVAVSHGVIGEHGADVGPCASTSSDEWHFAWGDTSRDARSFVALFNPFPGDAVVDITAVTDDGVREPRALTGLVVPGGSVVLADVGAEVRRRDHVSITVEARSGRVVAERLESFDGTGETEREGMTLDLGVAAPQETWVHAYGRLGDGMQQRLAVYNPTDAPAEVDVEISLGPDAVGGIEAFELTLRPHAFEVIDLGAEPRVLEQIGTDDTEFGITVRSLNGTPVVSDLVTTLEGVTVSGGSAATSPTQVLVDVRPGGASGRLRLLNLDTEQEAEVAIEVIRQGRRTPLDLEESRIGPAGRLIVDLEEVGTGASAIVVTSSEPLVAELVSRWSSPQDHATQSGIPTADGLRAVPGIGG